MANKQYISIIRLFDHCGIAIDNFNLSRAKKQLQAEFGITQSGFIEVDGFSYSRHSVFEEIEDPDFPKRMAFHRQIWNSPQMLELLEKNTINFDTIEDAFKPFWKNKEFDIFFSSYFTGPFSYLSRTFLADARLKEMGNLLCFEDFIQPAEREEAFRPLSIFLDESTRILRNVNRENYELMKPKIDHWIKSEWHVLLNNLPHEFYDIKQEITIKLINIGVTIQRSHAEDCRSMSEQLILLEDIPQNIRDTISSNHEAYTRSSPSLSWKGAFWIFWVAISLFRVVSSDGCSGSSNKYEFKEKDIKFILSDSLLKKLKDSSVNIKW